MNSEPSTLNIYAKKKLREENDLIASLLRPYATFLVKFPSIALLLLLLTIVGCAVLGVVPAAGAKDFPDFSKPTKGFEARGTTISSRWISFVNLQNLINPGSTRREKRSTESDVLDYYTYVSLDLVFIYEHVKKKNLLGEMVTICNLHKQRIMNFPLYSKYVKEPAHHLPNYIKLFANKSDCSDITADDTNSFFQLVKNCSTYYINNQFQECMNDESKCTSISSTCRSHPLLPNNNKIMARMFYNVFFYLTDSNFINNMDSLKQTSSFARTDGFKIQTEFFDPLYDKELKDLSKTTFGHVKIVAFELYDFKFHIFQSAIIVQSLFIVTAIVLVILLVWFYTGSIFIGLMTFLCVIIATIITYFVYGRVFDMDFFPFLNMVTTIFIVGIGADDAFVYTGIWEEAKKVYVIENAYEHVEYLIKWTIHTLRHALLAMFVTSLTTACAFYANISSSVTSVKNFGIYSGTVIIVNYLLMATFFPVVVILHDKYLARCMHACFPQCCKTKPTIFDDVEHEQTNNSIEMHEIDRAEVQQSKPDSCFSKLQKMIDTVAGNFFSTYLPTVILKLRYGLILFFFTIGIGATIVTFANPGMQPPSTGDFQMFSSSSSIEQYDLNYKKNFKFGLSTSNGNRWVYFVFGIKAIDNGNHYNPDGIGSVEFDATLNMADEQVWLNNFCKNLANASFFVSSDMCAFLSRYTSTCATGVSTCCGKSLPAATTDFIKCLKNEMSGQILFDSDKNVKAFYMSAATKYQYTQDFDENKKLFNEMESWFDEQTSTRSSNKGWWFVEQKFYDLQTSLFQGTKESVAISIAVAFVVILLTTWNIFLSIYSILTITFIISATVGILILSGWRLNIMESVVFSVAAGLAADFTLHYSVAYRTSLLKDNRVDRMKSALAHIGPAIMMGAFTTFITGLAMVPSSVLVYVQMAQFLMLVMFVSWFLSTFFFLPLCAVIGPVNNFGQLSCPKKKYTGGANETYNGLTNATYASRQNVSPDPHPESPEKDDLNGTNEKKAKNPVE